MNKIGLPWCCVVFFFCLPARRVDLVPKSRPSYEGNKSGDKTTQNDLKYPKGQKNTSEVSLIESLN